jgi:hypothetical protein
MPHLAVPFLAGHASGSGRFGCRLSSRPLPQCPRAPAAVARVSTVPAACELRVSAGRVRGRRFGPPMSAGGADLARNPGASAEPDTAAVSAGRPGVRPAAGRTAALRRGHGRGSPEQGRDMAVAGRRPSMHAPPAAAVDANRRRRCLRRRNLDASGCPDERVRRTACCRSRRTLWQCPRCVRTAAAWRWCPDGRCPPRTPPQPAGVRGYRNRSSGRRPLDGCRHRRDARASWRCSRSPSWPRT